MMRNIADLEPNLQALIRTIEWGARHYAPKRPQIIYSPNGAREMARRKRQLAAGKLTESEPSIVGRSLPEGAFEFMRAARRRSAKTGGHTRSTSRTSAATTAA